MRQPNVTVYGSRQCSETRRATRYLDDHQVPYEFKDVDEEPELGDYIASLNNGHRVMPTIRVNNKNLINPSERELGEVIKATSPAS
jgi:thioredoxin reductase (NADPH)